MQPVMYPNDSSSSVCQTLNAFQNLSDRDRWNDLCQQEQKEDEDTSTLVERLTALMAQEECEEWNNPVSATDSWIHNMRMTNEQVTFQCFHLPDQLE
jgi:hypothetical protein